MQKYTRVVGLLLVLALSACTTVLETNPQRSATEQLLISTAADRAAERLALQIPEKSSIFVDASNFEGTDSKYAISAIRDALLRRGARFVDDKKQAQIIVEIRSGALSTDKKETLVGIPEFNVPVPLASNALTLPALALYKNEEQVGIAKFGITGYDAKTGKPVAAIPPQFGSSYNRKKTILLFFSWRENDVKLEEGMLDR